MISLYRGHILLGISLVCAAIGFVAGYRVFYVGGVTGWWEFILLVTAMGSTIVAGVLFAFSYTMWVPKWERDEKRSGLLPGEKVADDQEDQRALTVESVDPA